MGESGGNQEKKVSAPESWESWNFGVTGQLVQPLGGVDERTEGRKKANHPGSRGVSSRAQGR